MALPVSASASQMSDAEAGRKTRLAADLAHPRRAGNLSSNRGGPKGNYRGLAFLRDRKNMVGPQC